MTTRLRCAIDLATTLLADAGINSARYNAEELAAHLTGAERGRLALIDSPDDTFFDRYDAAITARSRRVPQQHITGTAAFGPLTLFVGPGVFIPRPETEVMLEWSTAQCLPGAPARPLIVDVFGPTLRRFLRAFVAAGNTVLGRKPEIGKRSRKPE